MRGLRKWLYHPTHALLPPGEMCHFSHLFSLRLQVNFMLEFEFSCTSLHSRVQMKLHAARWFNKTTSCAYWMHTLFFFLNIASTKSGVMCSYVTFWFFCSDSVEREDTLGDNSVQLQSFVQYEPDLFVSRYICVQHTVWIFNQPHILCNF